MREADEINIKVTRKLPKKPNKVVKKQIDEMFKPLEKHQPQNAAQIKEQFTKDLIQTFDILPKAPPILYGVGMGTDIDMEPLLELEQWGTYEDWLHRHKKTCAQCLNDEECEEIECADIDSEYTIFTDGKFIVNEDGFQGVEGDSISIKYNWNACTFQVLKSPIIEQHRLASGCYLEHGDLDREGEHRCYALPKEYRRE
jgi:hypothetical protein